VPDVYARAVDQAQARLLELHDEQLQDLGLGAAGLAASLGASGIYPPFAIPLLVGSVAMGVLGSRAMWRRWDLVDRLADERGAYAIPEVREYAARDARFARRTYYATVIRTWARETTGGWGSDVRSDLEELASDLENAALDLDPASALACRRLATDPSASPLFAEGRDPEGVRLRIARIRAGFRPVASSTGR
jgi:hypothetical protein